MNYYMGNYASDLWECSRCRMIGPTKAAVLHESDTGHQTRRLSEAEKRGVVDVWHREGRCWRCGAADHYSEGCPL